MTAQEFLLQYKKQNDYAERLKDRYLEARARVESIQSSLAETGEVKISRRGNYAEDKILNLNAAREAYVNAAYDALLVRSDMFSFLFDIHGIDGEILIERYLNLKTWPQIQKMLGRSQSALFLAHKRGLRVVQEKLDSENSDKVC